MANEKKKLDTLLGKIDSDVKVMLKGLPNSLFDYISGTLFSMALLRGYKVSFVVENCFYSGNPDTSFAVFNCHREFCNGLFRAYGNFELSPQMRKAVKPEYINNPSTSLSNLSFYISSKQPNKSYLVGNKSGFYIRGLWTGEKLSFEPFDGTRVKSINAYFNAIKKNAREVPVNDFHRTYMRFN